MSTKAADSRFRSPQELLAWINHELELISETQHRLAVHKTVLQEQATRLRLGAPIEEVELALHRAGLDRRGQRLLREARNIG